MNLDAYLKVNLQTWRVKQRIILLSDDENETLDEYDTRTTIAGTSRKIWLY